MTPIRPFTLVRLGVGVLLVAGSIQLHAQTLTALKTDATRVAVGTPVTAYVEFTPADNNWCGFFIDWGDGKEHQSFRIGKPPDLTSPVNRKRTFDRPGSYIIRAYGEFVTRGLRSASACAGAPKSLVVTVFDPVAEEQQRRAEAQRRAEEAELEQAKNAAERAKADAELERAKNAAERAKADAELERAKDAAERAKADAERLKIEAERQKKALELREMELKRKELELREQALRRAEQEKKSSSPPPARAPAEQAAPRPSAPPPVKPADGF